MPFSSISGGVDMQGLVGACHQVRGHARFGWRLSSSSPMTPALELRSLKAVDRIQLVKALQSFEDINQQALTDHESESCKSLVAWSM